MSRGPYTDEDAANESVSKLLMRFYEVNFKRVTALVEHSRTQEGDLASDILRAAVVLLHATIEDFLRSLEGLLLPYCDADSLKDIPLDGLDEENEKNTKFHLGNLAAHRGKTVEDVIRSSVEKRLLLKSYNDTKQITNILRKLKIKIKKDRLESLLSPIGNLITRRHQIAHRADCEQNDKLSPISPEQVEQWKDATLNFVIDVLGKISNFHK